MPKPDVRLTSAVARGDLEEEGSTPLSTSTFLNDATRAWNRAPTNIKDTKILYSKVSK